LAASNVTVTGAVAERTVVAVRPNGCVVGLGVSVEMLALVRRRVEGGELRNLELLEDRAESIPADAGVFDVVPACLSMMYVRDREAGGR